MTPAASLQSRPSRIPALVHGLFIVLVAALLCFPCLLAGIPMGHDSFTHTHYQYHFSRQFWSGDTYPRWLTGANKGYGTPIFLIQYPLPYFATAILRPILPFAHTATREARELGVFFFLVIAACGLCARAWFRRYCSPYGLSTEHGDRRGIFSSLNGVPWFV